MKAGELFSGLLPIPISRGLFSNALIAINSRPRRGREKGRVFARQSFTLALIVGLSATVCASFGFAKPRKRTEEIAIQYSINKRPEDSNGQQLRRKLIQLLSIRNVRLFLDVIRKAEGGQSNLMVGGCKAASLMQHPAMSLPSRCWYRIKLDGQWQYSTASGNYQITLSNWKEVALFLGLRDFSETSQALAALELIRRGDGAAKAVTTSGLAIKRRIQRGFVELLRGNLKSALCMATYDWASSTCSPLPASIKLNYAKLAETISESNKAPIRKGRADSAESRK